MPFTPILPTDYQSDRQDLNDAIEAIIGAFISSQGYAIGRKFMSEVPESLTGEGPLIALGDVTEEIRFTAQLWITTFTGSMYWIDWLTDRQESNNRANVFADHMRSLFAVNRSTVNGAAVLQQTGFTEGELRQGNIVMNAPQLHYTYVVQRGDPGGNPA